MTETHRPQHSRRKAQHSLLRLAGHKGQGIRRPPKDGQDGVQMLLRKGSLKQPDVVLQITLRDLLPFTRQA